MMGFITGMNHQACDICTRTFVATATGKSHPYDDYSCGKCGWRGTICGNCGMKKCPKCSDQIKSTHNKGHKGIMY